jgi:CRP/FNR family transcriptional regulator, anaerobic regulatory protein
MLGTPEWISLFPAIARLTAEVRKPLIENGVIVALKAGSRIFGPGHAPDSFILLIDGTLRIQQVSEGGREIVLYRIAAGESCPLTTACMMNYEDYLAEAVAETDIRAVAVPRATFDGLIAASSEFRQFVFTAISRRVTNLFRVIDDVAFQRMDIRLAQKLLELASDTNQLDITQQQLAAELGTVREVVGRMLNEFQRRGWVEASRGSIAICNRPAIESLARDH